MRTEESTNGPRPVAGFCRLKLVIQDTEYAVRPIRDTQRRLLGWRLIKADGTTHDLDTDAQSCDCADFTFRRQYHDPKGCKHMASLRVCGLLPEAPPMHQRGDAS